MSECKICKTKKDKKVDNDLLLVHSLIHKYNPEQTLAPIQRKLFYDVLSKPTDINRKNQ